jgi:hypothetical protein
MKNRILTVIAMAAGLMAAAPSVLANAELELISGATSTFYNETGTSGTFTESGITASWSSVGAGYVDIGAFISSQMTILFSDNGNAPAIGTITLAATGQDVTGNLGGNVKFYYSTSDNLLAKTTQLGVTANVPGSTTQMVPISSASTYSLTEQITINHGSGKLSIDDSMTPPATPDGGMTLAMLGLPLIALGAVGRRLAKQN